MESNSGNNCVQVFISQKVHFALEGLILRGSSADGHGGI
jgi:hypothetical protein